MSALFDYRKFLSERYQTQKLSNAHFSARYFARKAGMSSPSYFSMIISGKRKLSPKFAGKVAKGLKLNDRETQLILKSAELESCDNPLLKLRLMNEVNKLSQKVVQPKLMHETHIEILSRPLELSLYVLSQSTQFVYDVAWVCKQPGFSEIKITSLKRAMHTLVESSLWQVEDRKIIVRPSDLEAGSRSLGPALKLSHLRFLEMAKHVLVKRSPEQRVFLAQTFLCNPDKMAQIERRLSQFKLELEAEFEDLNSTSVYQLNLGFYPFKLGEDSDES